MKLNILNLKGEEKGTIELPRQFSESFRPDLIKRAVLALRRLQPHGVKKGAGMRHSAELSRRRRKYRGSYGLGISRVPRKILSRRGTRFFWVGASAPGTVGGPEAHPPKAEKITLKKINNKERKKAIRSALSASMNKEIVSERGHRVPENYPFVLTSDIELIDKTKQLKETLTLLGLADELSRTKEKSIRAGRGKMRGRKYKRKVGPVIVIGKECALEKVRSLPGVDIIKVHELNSEILAPGTNPGRLLIFSEDALKRIKEEGLFQ